MDSQTITGREIRLAGGSWHNIVSSRARWSSRQGDDDLIVRVTVTECNDGVATLRYNSTSVLDIARLYNFAPSSCARGSSHSNKERSSAGRLSLSSGLNFVAGATAMRLGRPASVVPIATSATHHIHTHMRA